MEKYAAERIIYMKSILMGSPDKVFKVFAASVRETLKAEANLDDSRIVTKDDLVSGQYDAKDVTYIFATWGMAHLTEDEIKTYLPSLKAVFYAAGTVQYFAREFLACGVQVFSAWAANAVPVAEYTVAEIVLANKGFFRTCRMSSGSLEGRKAAAGVFAGCRGNYGANVGIIGAGMIGRMVLERLKQYKLNVFVCDPFLSDEKAKELGAVKVTLEELFANCDVISNHVANLPATVGMMKGSHFASMKKNATFINTGRGAQIVEPEFTEVLRARPDITAVLDVTDPEPPKEDSPFYSLDNVFLTPHIAGSAGDEVVRMAEYMKEEFEAFEAGKETRFGVTFKMFETMA